MEGIQAEGGDESDGRQAGAYVRSMAATVRDSVGETEGDGADPGAPETEGSTALPLDTLFSILSNERRRLALHTLRREGEMDRRELAEEVAALENGKEQRDVTSAERKRVYVSLHQHHLPKLDDADAAVCEGSRVEAGPNAGELLSFLPGERPQPTPTPAPTAPPAERTAMDGCAPLVGLAGAGVFAAGAIGLSTPIALAGAAVAAVSTLALTR